MKMMCDLSVDRSCIAVAILMLNVHSDRVVKRYFINTSLGFLYIPKKPTETCSVVGTVWTPLVRDTSCLAEGREGGDKGELSRK